MSKDKNPVVYSTASGRVCPSCGKPAESCVCKTRQAQLSAPPTGGIRVRREKQGRAGKEVTVIREIPGSADEIRKYAVEIKKKCGSGGSIEDRTIIIQGNQVDFVLKYFSDQGFKIKRDGG